MELLIPGLIIVALMVYASTRIKRTAAAAFEAETVETVDFTISKPEGFLTVVNGDPRYAFESYSKDYAGEGAENFKMGRADLTIHRGATLREVAAAIALSDGKTVSDSAEVVAGRRYRVIERTRVEDGV